MNLLCLKRYLYKFTFARYFKPVFLLSCEGKKIKLIDIGCGNNSPLYTKNLCKDCYYVGIDVGDCNQSSGSLDFADEYHIFEPENFAKGIDTLQNDFDLVISTHNIEHCNAPMETLKAMCRSGPKSI